MRLERAGYRLRVVRGAKVLHSSTIRGFAGGVRSPAYYFLMTRNEWYFWNRYLIGRIARLKLFLRWLGNAVADAAMCRHRRAFDCADACLDGVWSALANRMGPPNCRLKMPKPIRYALSSHPFLIAALLRGDVSALLRRQSESR
jgi:hypothetical protein